MSIFDKDFTLLEAIVFHAVNRLLRLIDIHLTVELQFSRCHGGGKMLLNTVSGDWDLQILASPMVFVSSFHYFLRISFECLWVYSLSLKKTAVELWDFHWICVDDCFFIVGDWIGSSHNLSVFLRPRCFEGNVVEQGRSGHDCIEVTDQILKALRRWLVHGGARRHGGLGTWLRAYKSNFLLNIKQRG